MAEDSIVEDFTKFKFKFKFTKFTKFMEEKKTDVENFLRNFEAYATPEVIEAIASGKKGNAMKLSYQLQMLFKHYGDMDEMDLTEPQIEEYRLQTSQQLAKHSHLLKSLSRLCAELYKQHADDCFETDDQSLKGTFTMQQNLLTLIIFNFHNYSDCGVEICLALSEIDLLFDELVKPMLIHWLDKHNEKPICRALVNSALGFTYNMFYKNNSTIYNRLAQLQVVEPAMPYLKSSLLQTQVQALVLIAFALDESKSKFYESASATEVMQFLVSGLRESLDAQDRRYDGYHTTELSICVNRLALNEVNKDLLVKLGILPVLHVMCSGDKAEDAAAALDILFTLSFKEENRPLIREQFLDILQKLFSCNTANKHTGALWRNYDSMQGLDVNLGGLIAASCPSVAKPAPPGQQTQPVASDGDQHVMISYQHEQKQLVMRIKEALEQNGIKVWIDYERMCDGCVMSLMASAVEDSYAFLMCVSRSYKNSNNCRLEATYAYKTQKRIVPLLLEPKYKPNGWLGLLLGTDMYHDFSGKYPFEAKLAEVLQILQQKRPAAIHSTDGQQLQQRQATPASASGRPSSSSGSRAVHHFPSAHATLPPIGSSGGQIKQWTSEQVRKWATERCMPDIVLDAGLSGEDLHFLAVARDRAPEAFYRMSERYLPTGAPVVDVARFVNALYEL